jgi:hypothetical protein
MRATRGLADDCRKWLWAVPAALLAMGGTVTAQVAESDGTRVTCRPVTVAAFHSYAALVGGSETLAINQQLARITGGRVPCLDVDTANPTMCVFRTADETDENGSADAVSASDEMRSLPTGSWLEDKEGRRYALAGQMIAKDGARTGNYRIGARVTGSTVPCVGDAGFDSAGTMTSTTLSGSCTVETLNATTNAIGKPIVNYATQPVCTSSYPHPDGAQLVSADPVNNIYCYSYTGAGLNDINGTERDQRGVYYPSAEYCHVVQSGGVVVPAAKRPSTKSLPYPHVIPNTPIRWLVAIPSVTIAN